MYTMYPTSDAYNSWPFIRNIIQTNCSAGLCYELERLPLIDMSQMLPIKYSRGQQAHVYSVYCYTLNTANARLCTCAIGPTVLAHADLSTKLTCTQRTLGFEGWEKFWPRRCSWRPLQRLSSPGRCRACRSELSSTCRSTPQDAV